MQKNWRELVRPKRIEVDKETLTGTYGKFVAEPLERGFGVTLGNSLRRIMLSSLHGAAITAVKFDGVLHEFSTIPDVQEDVSDIILNLKAVKFKMYGEGPKTVRLEASGETDLKAGDIVCDPSIEVLNPEQHIAFVSKEGSLSCDLTVNSGTGYQPSERNKSTDTPIGTIQIDALFQPVSRANFNVTQARVGQRTDYDKLTLEVWTTGALEPQETVAIAAKILKDQMTVFINFQEEDEDVVEAVAEKPVFNENLFKTVEELELSVRSANCLKNADIKYIGEMVQKTEQEMLRTKNFGRKSLNEIKEILRTMSLDFGMQIEGFLNRKELDELHLEQKETV
ncbi:MAG: DNA-directed RNA polymerase subunit alpha [Thermodesulfobacteriota bacterium]